MLRPLRFLWRQFNGPQVSAICTAVFRYMQKQFNETIDYFRHFSITTATGDHLTLIGACMGVVRPLVPVFNEELFLFTRDYGENSERGFADLENRAVGGIFTDLEDDVRRTRYLCPTEMYRKILLGALHSQARIQSLTCIDTIISDVWDSLHPNEPSPVTFRFYDVGETPNRTSGDIDVSIGTMAQWGGSDETAGDTIALRWQSVFANIFNALFNPERYIDINFNN